MGPNESRRRGQTVEKSRRTEKDPRADPPGSSHDILRREIPVAACVAWAKHWSTPGARHVKEVVFYGLLCGGSRGQSDRAPACTWRIHVSCFPTALSPYSRVVCGGDKSPGLPIHVYIDIIVTFPAAE